MKFLFDAGQLYGFNVDSYEERVYLLHIFMLAFSSDDARRSMKDVVLTGTRFHKAVNKLIGKRCRLNTGIHWIS